MTPSKYEYFDSSELRLVRVFLFQLNYRRNRPV